MAISVEERVQLARDYFKQGFNCSQSVVLAFKDVVGLDDAAIERLTIGLGGGVGRLREVCGAVSGMAVVAGSMGVGTEVAGVDAAGKTAFDARSAEQNVAGAIADGKTADRADAAGKTAFDADGKTVARADAAEKVKTPQLRKQETYALVQNLAGRFREENGSIICRELLGNRIEAKTSPVPQERNAEYYKIRPCEEMVACAARLLAEKLG